MAEKKWGRFSDERKNIFQNLTLRKGLGYGDDVFTSLPPSGQNNSLLQV